MAGIGYFAGDERPAWQPTITIDGSTEDYSTGFSFKVEVLTKTGTVQFTKTTGITGNSDGSVTVDWATSSELSTLDPGVYVARLRIRRDSDSKDVTLEADLSIRAGVSA